MTRANAIRLIIVLGVAASSIVLPTLSRAQGSLMINPKRCVFEGNKRNDVVTLYNESEDTTSYAISYKHYQMLENGDFKDIDSVETNDLFCDKIVKYFPKQVTLGPHESQTVRLQLLKPRDLAPGEYRSHLYFRAIERAQALEAVRKDTTKSITLSLKAVYGLAIPVIVRNATTPATVTLTNLKLSKPDTGGYAVLTVDINRTGNESSYGEFFLSYKDVSNESQLADVKGVGVYVPLPKRTFPIRLKMPEIVSLSTGKLILEYRTMTGKPKEDVIASAELPLK